MWSAGSEPPVRLDLRPSRALAGLLLATHLGAGASVLASGLASWAQAAAAVALIASLVHNLRRYALLTTPSAVVSLLGRGDGLWDLRLASGATQTAELLPGSLVHPLLVVLRLRLAGEPRIRIVPIASDMLDRDAHRRLRVRLTLTG